MDVQMVNYGYGVVLALAALYANFKIQKSQMDSAVSKGTAPIIKTLDEHGNILKDHGEMIKHNSVRLDKYAVNDNFHYDIDTAVKSGLEMLGCDTTPASYIIKMGQRISDFYREVMVDGIAKDKRTIIISRVESKCSEGKKFLADLLSPEFCEKYFKKYEKERCEYLKDIIGIAEGIDNNKNDRFRVTTLLFAQNQIHNFVRYYLTHWKR